MVVERKNVMQKGGREEECEVERKSVSPFVKGRTEGERGNVR
jgi:hypothetical protein